MANILVLYYSLTGNTETVAGSLASRLQADLEPLRDVKERSGWLSHLGMAWEVIFKAPAKIMPLSKAVADYDLVVLGAPVWAGDMASPMRRLLKTQGGAIKKLAVFCTEQGAGGEGALKKMAALCGKPAIAELIVLEKEIKAGGWESKADAFVGAVGEAAGMGAGDSLRRVV